MMMKRNIWFQFAKKPGSRDPGIRPIKDKVHRFVTGVQPKFKQNKVWLPRTELLKNTNIKLLELVMELENELSKFTMAGGVKSLAHDDAIDLLNQLSEMEIYQPSVEAAMEKSVVGDDGLIWSSVWDDEVEQFAGGSTVF
jgi:hypothetical protein